MTNTKKMKMRAFDINQIEGITSESFDIINLLKEKDFEHTSVGDRKMRLSENDENYNEDFASIIRIDNNIIHGIILRIKQGSQTSHIPNDFFNRPSFSINELESQDNEFYGEYMMHYYFCMDKDNLIVSLPGNYSIKIFSVYVNWLIGGAMYQFAPIIEMPEQIPLSEVKEIEFKDPRSNIISNTLNVGSENRNYKIGLEAIKKMLPGLNDTSTLSDHELDQIVSAQLVVKFSKPKGMRDEDYQRRYGAIFAPVSDAENIVLKTKNGRKIQGDDCQKIKTVDITTVPDNDKLFVDEDVFQQMRIFLNELSG